jgi:hypothetical protein
MNTSSCRATARTHSWHFSSEFLAQYKPQSASGCSGLQATPAHEALDVTYTPATKSESLLSYENAQRLINIATIIFATMQIYERYQIIGSATQPTVDDYQLIVAIKKLIAAWCPSIVQSAGVYGFFLVDSTAIVFKALVYKAIAKLLLLCVYGDISDLIGSIVHGGINTAKLAL